MKTLEEFRQFYTTGLRPRLERYEAQRKKILTTFAAIAGGIVLLVIVIGALLLALTSLDIVHSFGIVGVIGALGIAGVWWWLTSDFILKFKSDIIAQIVRFCDPGLSYSPKAHITESEFRACGIFKHRVDRFRGEDLVSGKVGATQMKFSEMHAEYKTETTDSKGRRHTQWHTIFKGLFFIGDFNKHFSGKTVVLPDTAERLFGLLGKTLQSVFKHSGELIKLEDPEFEKHFVVYGSDQVEARYILSTSLMKRITDFRSKHGKPVYVSFVRSCVHVAVTTGKNMFEPRILRSLLDFEMAEDYLEDLEFALGIVEDLNLNTRIWTKR